MQQAVDGGARGIDAVRHHARDSRPSARSKRSHPGPATCYVWTVPPAERGTASVRTVDQQIIEEVSACVQQSS